ncbi:MAG: DUF423 domain-containing protein [Candidatus Omnitrophica bacterium]|nr:DUF423 domain-containing protein [Candidatus Omnitrophota bacterium]
MKSDFESQQKLFLSWAAASGFISVAMGAFAAHAIKGQLSSELMEVFQTGIRYQMFHTVALAIVAFINERSFHSWTTAAGWFFIVGIFLFSGSLYALALSGVRIWGAVTPWGGLCFLIGWMILFLGNQKNP